MYIYISIKGYITKKSQQNYFWFNTPFSHALNIPATPHNEALLKNKGRNKAKNF